MPGPIVQGVGGQWTDVTPDTLATMLQAKDFTLLNVKTPYVGEIEGTDLYIPYTDLRTRAAELPSDRAARIVVYCRSGRQSAIAAQTLLDLGYTNILNLDGGVEAWVASGRALVPEGPHLTAGSDGGRGGGIRTHGLMLPKHVRYQAALRPDGAANHTGCRSASREPVREYGRLSPTPDGSWQADGTVRRHRSRH